jgi:hypothetical protein
MEVEDGGVVENDCPIQSAFPAYAALPPQPFDLARWSDDESLCLGEAAHRLLGDAQRAGFETTVAGAILLPTPDPSRAA